MRWRCWSACGGLSRFRWSEIRALGAQRRASPPAKRCCALHVRARFGLLAPAGVEVVRDADQIEQSPGHEVDQVVDGFGVKVEAGVERRDDRAGFAEALHV